MRAQDNPGRWSETAPARYTPPAEYEDADRVAAGKDYHKRVFHQDSKRFGTIVGRRDYLYAVRFDGELLVTWVNRLYIGMVPNKRWERRYRADRKARERAMVAAVRAETYRSRNAPGAA